MYHKYSLYIKKGLREFDLIFLGNQGNAPWAVKGQLTDSKPMYT